VTKTDQPIEKSFDLRTPDSKESWIRCVYIPVERGNFEGGRDGPL